jgi:hypothetical protein
MWIEAMSMLRIIRAIDPVTIDLARFDIGEETMPDLMRLLRE